MENTPGIQKIFWDSLLPRVQFSAAFPAWDNSQGPGRGARRDAQPAQGILKHQELPLELHVGENSDSQLLPSRSWLHSGSASAPGTFSPQFLKDQIPSCSLFRPIPAFVAIPWLSRAGIHGKPPREVPGEENKRTPGSHSRDVRLSLDIPAAFGTVPARNPGNPGDLLHPGMSGSNA